MITERNKDNESHCRRIEAMYRKGYSADQISIAIKMSKIKVLDVMQRIFACDMKKSPYGDLAH